MVIDERQKKYRITSDKKSRALLGSFSMAQHIAEELAPKDSQRAEIHVEQGGIFVLCAWRENGLWNYIESIVEQP